MSFRQSGRPSIRNSAETTGPILIKLPLNVHNHTDLRLVWLT
jgi:hypothetical protein